MLLLILIVLSIPWVQNQSPAKVLFDDHAIVTPRRIERTRGKGEDRYTEVMITPVVTGLRPPVLKSIRKQLELKKVLGGHHVFYKNKMMFGFDYRVTHNRNHILAITFSWNAYFAGHEKALAFDLRDGSLIKPQDLFLDDKIPDLVKLIDQKLQAELQQMIRDYEGSRDIQYVWKAENAPLKITPDDLAEFAINDKGITFFYDPHFGHRAAWAEPEGRYFFTYGELKSFLKPDTVVSQFVK
jgi:hypothetical protein